MELRKSALTWTVVGDELVVLDLDGAIYLSLNDSARLLWEQLSSSCDEDEMIAALANEFGIDHTAARRDVTAFLDELRHRQLLVE